MKNSPIAHDIKVFINGLDEAIKIREDILSRLLPSSPNYEMRRAVAEGTLNALQYERNNIQKIISKYTI